MQFLRGKARLVPAALVLLLATCAGAGVLLGDGNAMFSGTKTFTDTMMLVDSVDAEYAVFAPGQFAVSFPGSDPTGGAEYVYAHQLNGAVGTMPWDNLFGLSVGFLDVVGPFDPPGLPVGNVGFVETDATASPTTMWVARLPNDVATSVLWQYGGDLARGHWSDVLFYTSPWGPAPVEDWDSSNVTSLMGLVTNETLPHPIIPEPATLTLMTAGLVAICRRRIGRH